MIYLENTTDTQTIFIDREIQSIENITPITLDSNYYTKTETNEQIANSLNQAKRYTDTEVLKLDAELENINEDIDVLEERIIDLENNGGGSSTDKPTHIITIYAGFMLTLAQISEIKQKFETHKVIVKSIATKTSIVEITNVVYNTSNNNYIAVYGISENELYEWKYDTTTTYINPAKYKIVNETNYATTQYVDEEILKVNNELENINEDIDVLEGRIIDLENNGGGSSTDNNTHFIDEEKGELDYAQFYDVIDRFKNGQRVILETSDGDVNIVCVDNRSIVGISTDECIITWSNTYPLERIDKRIYNVSITNRDLQTEINTTNRRIDEVERVRVLDVSNGMTAEQFNTIFNNFKTINYKYLLNIGNNDLFNICSIQQANRSITAMGFDDYEGEIMCYTWFAPQQSSTPELTKRKITTEIV